MIVELPTITVSAKLLHCNVLIIVMWYTGIDRVADSDYLATIIICLKLHVIKVCVPCAEYIRNYTKVLVMSMRNTI